MVASQVSQLPWDEAAIEAMASSVAASPWGALNSVPVALGRSHLWDMQAGGQRALIAVRGLDLDHGRQLDVIGLRSLGDRLQAPVLSEALDAIAAAYGHVDLMTMCTRHPHLVRGCLRQGWAETGTVMNKHLRLQ